MQALVTGATSGIGEALAHLLHEKGYSLMLTGRNEEKLASLKEELGAETMALDLRERSARAQIVKWIESNAPELVINSAGLGLFGEVFDYSTDEQMEVLDVNISATYELTDVAARSLIAAGKKGTILNISSVVALQKAIPGFAVYDAAKRFVRRVSEALDRELRPKGVRVLVSLPGLVETPFHTRAHTEKGRRLGLIRPIPVETAARETWKQIEKGKGVHAYNALNRWLTRSSWLLPSTLAYKVSGHVFKLF